jgi:uncharacterized RDD family membrane protein YckC
MTNPLKAPKESITSRLISGLLYSLVMSLFGGLALMIITSVLLPVGLGYWASAVVVLFARSLWIAVTDQVDS